MLGAILLGIGALVAAVVIGDMVVGIARLLIAFARKPH